MPKTAATKDILCKIDITFKDPCESTNINSGTIPLGDLKMQSGTNFITSVKYAGAKNLGGNTTHGVVFKAFHDTVSRDYGSLINLPDVDTGTQICGPREYIMGGDWDPGWGTPSPGTTTYFGGNNVYLLT